MRHEQESTQVGTENKYGYNGKELNQDFDLNLSDYGTRWYDASIGRWHSVDPLAESFSSMSPYNYSFNNPVRFTDPDGMAPEDIIYKDNDGNEIYREEAEGEDIVHQAAVVTASSSSTVKDHLIGFAKGVANTVIAGVTTSPVTPIVEAVTGKEVPTIETNKFEKKGALAGEATTAVLEPSPGGEMIVGSKYSIVLVGYVKKAKTKKPRVPEGELWVNRATNKPQKGGTYVSPNGEYVKFTTEEVYQKALKAQKGHMNAIQEVKITQNWKAKVMEFLGGIFDDPRH